MGLPNEILHMVAVIIYIVMVEEIMNEVQVVKIAKQNKKKNLGASMVEYAILVALIAAIGVATIQLLGSRVSSRLSEAASGADQQ